MKHFSFLLLLFGVVACQPGAEKTNEPLPRVIHRVEVDRVRAHHDTDSHEYSGLIEARQRTPLSFKTPGTVTEILVSEGQYVKAGQLLARLDDTDAQSAYHMADLSRQQAQDAYDRMQPMYQKGTLPEIQWVEVETGLSQAVTSVELAERRIADAALYAPKSGVIGAKNIELGVNVMPGVSAFDLLDINTVYVNIPVPETEISQLSVGQPVALDIAAVPGGYQGRIDQIGVTASQMTHAYPVKIAVANKKWLLKPGMVAHASIATGPADSDAGVAISNKALQRDPQGKEYVYLLKPQDSTVTATPIRLTSMHADYVITPDLRADQLIVVSGQHKITDGTHVNYNLPADEQ